MPRKKSTTEISINNLNDALKKANMNKTKLSRATGLSMNTMHRAFGNGEASFETVNLLAKTLGVSPLYLLGQSDDVRSYEQTVDDTYMVERTVEQERFIDSSMALNEFMNNLTFQNPDNPKQIIIPSENLMVADLRFYEYMKGCALKYLKNNGFLDKLKEGE